MITLKDIAAKCGCSVATVSKALNGMPDISGATIERISKVASEMGYRTNTTPKPARGGRTMTIGLLCLPGTNGIWRNEHYVRIAESLQNQLDERGYDLVPIHPNNGIRTGNWMNYCRSRGYEGIVVIPGLRTDKALESLVESSIPMVSLDGVYPNRPAVLTDGSDSVYQLVRYAYSKGHRRIAFMQGEDCMVTQLRAEGFLRAIREFGLPIDYMCYGAFHDTARCIEETKRLMAMSERPTCILYPDDFTALGGLRWLQDNGYRVPEDVSVIGYDGLPLAEIVRPRLTTYRQDCENLGKLIAEQLFEALSRSERSLIKHISLPGTIVQGETVATI